MPVSAQSHAPSKAPFRLGWRKMFRLVSTVGIKTSVMDYANAQTFDTELIQISPRTPVRGVFGVHGIRCVLLKLLSRRLQLTSITGHSKMANAMQINQPGKENRVLPSIWRLQIAHVFAKRFTRGWQRIFAQRHQLRVVLKGRNGIARPLTLQVINL